MATVTEALADVDGIDMEKKDPEFAAALDVFRERRKAFTTRLVRSTAIGRLASDISARKSKLRKDFDKKQQDLDKEAEETADDGSIKVSETEDGEVIPRVERMISLLDDIDTGVIRLLDFLNRGPVPVSIVDAPDAALKVREEESEESRGRKGRKNRRRNSRWSKSNWFWCECYI